MFDTAAEYGVSTAPSSLVVVDLDGNGAPDVVVASSGSGFPYVPPRLSVRLGTGDGTLLAGPMTTLVGRPEAIAAADFDDDGLMDVVISTAAANLQVFLGNGNGTFQPPSIYDTYNQPKDVLTADFNGDGAVDVASLGRLSNVVTIFLGNGDGTLTDFEWDVAGTLGLAPEHLASADFDNDGDADLVASNSLSNGIAVFLGNGDGTLGPADGYATGEYPGAVGAADFNNDGHVDLAVALGSTIGLSLFLGNGDGTFQPEVRLDSGQVSDLSVPADLDQDGNVDIYLGGSALFGNGDGTFVFRRIGGIGGGSSGTDVADLNFDGGLDIVSNNYNGDVLRVAIGLCPEICEGSCPLEFVPSGSIFVGNIFGEVVYESEAINLEDPVSGFQNPAPFLATTLASLESGGTIVDGATEIVRLVARFEAVIVGNEVFLESEESGYLDASATGSGEVAVSVGFPFIFRVAQDGYFVASDGFTFDAFGNGASISGSFLTAGDYTLTVPSPFASMPAPGAAYSEITTAYFSLLDSCPGDIADPLGQVGIADLIALLAAWGTDGAGANVASPFGVVDVADLLVLLSSWGSCDG